MQDDGSAFFYVQPQLRQRRDHAHVAGLQRERTPTGDRENRHSSRNARRDSLAAIFYHQTAFRRGTQALRGQAIAIRCRLAALHVIRRDDERWFRQPGVPYQPFGQASRTRGHDRPTFWRHPCQQIARAVDGLCLVGYERTEQIKQHRIKRFHAKKALRAALQMTCP